MIFERHLAADRLDLLGEINDSHAAFADLLEERVGTDADARPLPPKPELTGRFDGPRGRIGGARGFGVDVTGRCIARFARRFLRGGRWLNVRAGSGGVLRRRAGGAASRGDSRPVRGLNVD